MATMVLRSDRQRRRTPLLQCRRPAAALLPEKVLLVTVSVAAVDDAAAAESALLPEKVLLVTVSVPLSLAMPPPPPLLPVKVLLVTVSVPSALQMPPPA